MSKKSIHLERISLKNDGVFEEVLIMSKNENTGDIYYIAVNDLDTIDKKRVIRILSRRDANNYPLYDLMANETLANGMNALEFFHQLVKIRTVNGDIFPVNSGKTGGRVEVQEEEAAAPRRPGRPPKQASE